MREPLRIAFFGTPAFAVPTLLALLEDPRFIVPVVITQPDAPQGRGRKLTPPPVKSSALSHNVPVVQPVSCKRERAVLEQELLQHGPYDGAVIVAFGQILPTWLLDLFQRRCVNVHASLLPRWRGAAPIARAILAGDTETGVCLMGMEEGLDTGPVFARTTTPITLETTGGELHDTLAAIGAALISKSLIDVLEGVLPGIPQAPEGVTYAAKIERSDQQISWHKPAVEIHRVIRAFSPNPCAFTEMKTSGEYERLKLGTALLGGEEVTGDAQTPGTIVSLAPDGVTVACGDGSTLILTSLQRAGRGMLPWSEFRKGGILSVGMKLGQHI